MIKFEDLGCMFSGGAGTVNIKYRRSTLPALRPNPNERHASHASRFQYFVYRLTGHLGGKRGCTLTTG